MYNISPFIPIIYFPNGNKTELFLNDPNSLRFAISQYYTNQIITATQLAQVDHLLRILNKLLKFTGCIDHIDRIHRHFRNYRRIVFYQSRIQTYALQGNRFVTDRTQLHIEGDRVTM